MVPGWCASAKKVAFACGLMSLSFSQDRSEPHGLMRLRNNRKIVILSEAKNLSFFDFART